MFENIGGKIKFVAQFFTWIGIMVSTIIGIGVITKSSSLGGVFLGLVIIVLGGFVSWLSALCLYGFGQLVENTDRLAGRQIPPYTGGQNPPNNDPVWWR